MSKKIVIILAVIVILLVGIAGYTKLNKSSSSPVQDTSGSSQQTGTSDETMSKGSIQGLLGQGKNVSCTISYPDAKIQDSKVYISGGKMRGDFSVMTDENKTVDSHMINDGTYMYSWSSMGSQGTKIKLDSIAEASKKADTTQNQNVDLNKEVDYKCSSWSVDSSMFVPPATIQFMDLSETMKQVQQQSPCDQITDSEAKAACQKAMRGN